MGASLQWGSKGQTWTPQVTWTPPSDLGTRCSQHRLSSRDAPPARWDAAGHSSHGQAGLGTGSWVGRACGSWAGRCADARPPAWGRVQPGTRSTSSVNSRPQDQGPAGPRAAPPRSPSSAVKGDHRAGRGAARLTVMSIKHPNTWADSKAPCPCRPGMSQQGPQSSAPKQEVAGGQEEPRTF